MTSEEHSSVKQNHNGKRQNHPCPFHEDIWREWRYNSIYS